MSINQAYAPPATPLQPMAGSISELYAVYSQIAERDHACRIQALYGVQPPPPGHTPFRPLTLEDFEHRFATASKLPDGELLFRQQLTRLAGVYCVEPKSTLARRAA